MIYLTSARVFALEVGLLLVGKRAGDALEPRVDSLFVHRKVRHALFVQKAHHGFILYSLLHGVGVDDAPENLLGAGLLLHEQGCTGKRDERRVGQGLPHELMRFAVLAAVAFVHQHDDIRAGVAAFLELGRALKLVDDGEKDALRAFAYRLRERAAGAHAGFGGFLLAEEAALHEVAQNLLFEVHSVGHHHDAALRQFRQKHQRLRQHDHGVRLAAARGVPDDAAGTLAVLGLAQAFYHGLDAEALLIAGRKTVKAVAPGFEQREEAHGLQKAGWRKQAHDHPVLIADCQRVLSDIIGGERGTQIQEAAAQPGFFRDEDIGIGEFFLAPVGPELGRSAAGAVMAAPAVHGKNELGVGEEVRDELLPLIAYHLGNSLRVRGLAVAGTQVGPFAFDDGQRKAVHVADHIGDDRAGAEAVGHGEFFRHMEDVIFGRLPVDDRDGAVRAFAVDELRDRDAVQEQIVNLFVRADEAVPQRRQERGDDLVYIGGREVEGFPARLKLTRQQILPKNGLEHHGRRAPALCAAAQFEGLFRRQIGIAHAAEKR